jgi:hypothetical protein
LSERCLHPQPSDSRQIAWVARPAARLDAAWNAPAYRFKSPEEVGTPVPTLRTLYQACGQNELVITSDGRYGYWRDETYTDAETLIAAKPTHSPHG